MTHYLTNIDKADADKVRRAAEISGQKVEYFDEPMPAHGGLYGRCRHQILSTHGCIVGQEEVFDYSKFWAAWRSLSPTLASHEQGTQNG